MMLDPKMINHHDSNSKKFVTMLPPKVQRKPCTFKKSYNTFNGVARPLPLVPPPFVVIPRPPPPLGYTLLTLGMRKVVKKIPYSQSHHTSWQPIKEYTHRLVLAYTFGGPPSPSHNIVLHTCGNVGCHQPHHLLYGTVTDNNIKSERAILRYKALAEEQDRDYYGPLENDVGDEL